MKTVLLALLLLLVSGCAGVVGLGQDYADAPSESGDASEAGSAVNDSAAVPDSLTFEAAVLPSCIPFDGGFAQFSAQFSTGQCGGSGLWLPSAYVVIAPSLYGTIMCEIQPTPTACQCAGAYTCACIEAHVNPDSGFMGGCFDNQQFTRCDIENGVVTVDCN